MLYERVLQSLRNVEDLLPGRGIGLCREIVPLWRNRLGPGSLAHGKGIQG